MPVPRRLARTAHCATCCVPRATSDALLGRQVLSWHPRIFLLHDFLTAAECDALIALALPELEASTVVDTATGGGYLSQVRTSSGMFIMEATPVTKVIRQRVAHLTLLPGTPSLVGGAARACCAHCKALAAAQRKTKRPSAFCYTRSAAPRCAAV